METKLFENFEVKGRFILTETYVNSVEYIKSNYNLLASEIQPEEAIRIGLWVRFLKGASTDRFIYYL